MDMVAETQTPTALDTADAILSVTGPIDQLTLHKLLYYVQGWHQAWYDEPIFEEDLQAWPKGPAVYSVYRKTKRWEDGLIDAPLGGDPRRLNKNAFAVVEAVAEAYKGFTGVQLLRATHDEEPWKRAREGLRWFDPSDRPLSKEEMKVHFRRHADFGGQSPDLSQIDPQTMGRVRVGDPDAVISALKSLAES